MVIGLDRVQPREQSENRASNNYYLYRLFEDKDEAKSYAFQKTILTLLMILIIVLSVFSFMWYNSVLYATADYLSTLLEPVLVLPYILLTHSLTSKHGSKTKLAAFLNLSVFQYLGDMSYSFYLTHVPTAEYLIWIIFGKYSFENDWQHTGLVFFPGWIIPVALIVALIIGRGFYIFIEKPMKAAIVERFFSKNNIRNNNDSNINKDNAPLSYEKIQQE